MAKRIEHNLFYIFQALIRKIELPFSFDKRVTFEKVDLEYLRSKPIFMDELSKTEQKGWTHRIGDFVAISACQICDLAVQGEEDKELGQLQEHAYFALRLVYPSSFMGSTAIRCEGWKMYKDLNTDELTLCFKEKEDDGFDYWSVGYNGFHQQKLEFFPKERILEQKHLEEAKKLYEAWYPETWFSRHVNIRIATNHLHSALKQHGVFNRYMGCFVTLESLYTSYEEFLANSPGDLYRRFVVPRLKSMIFDKLPEGLVTENDLNAIYNWRGVLAHRGTASFLTKEDAANSLSPDKPSMDRMLGTLEILARQSIITAWLDYEKYNTHVAQPMTTMHT